MKRGEEVTCGRARARNIAKRSNGRRVLLQQVASSFYFRKRRRWALSPGRAFAFRSPFAAIRYCKAKHMAGVRVVFRADPPASVSSPQLCRSKASWMAMQSRKRA